MPLDVYYDDDDLAVINKQAGLICHPSPKAIQLWNVIQCSYCSLWT